MNDYSGEEFVVFITSPDTVSHLKTEIELKYPDLHLGYNRPPIGLLSYKNCGKHFGLKMISNLNLTFARRSLLFKGKTVTSHLPPLLEKMNYPVHYYSLSGELLAINFKQEINQKHPIGKVVTDLIHLEKDLFYFCEHEESTLFSRSPGGIESISLPSEAPSRAYLKTAEAFARFSYRPLPGTAVLELGAAPGGSLYFLLNEGYKVTAVDPALLDESITSNPNLKHLHKSVQSVTRSDLDPDTKLLILDMNLSATQSINETIRIIEMLPRLETLLLTLKAPVPSIAYKIESYKERIKKLGFSRAITTTLHSHKKEFLIFATK